MDVAHGAREVWGGDSTSIVERFAEKSNGAHALCLALEIVFPDTSCRFCSRLTTPTMGCPWPSP